MYSNEIQSPITIFGFQAMKYRLNYSFVIHLNPSNSQAIVFIKYKAARSNRNVTDAAIDKIEQKLIVKMAPT